MKQIKLFGTLLCCMMISNLFAQQQVVLTFKGEDQSGNYVQLSKVVLANITQGWSDTLIYPDTTAILIVGNSSISEHNATALGLSQNTPNPFHGTTQVSIAVAESGPLSLEVLDINGRLTVARNFTLIDRGTHQFSIQLSTPQIYLLTALQNGNAFSIKMINKGNSGIDKIEYEGVVSDKNIEVKTKNNAKGIMNHPFSSGDSMSYKGDAFINNQEFESDIIVQTQTTSEVVTLIFEVDMTEDGQPCQGMATLTDIDGNTYNTVKIGNQCWMKENLRTTRYPNCTTISQGSTTSTTVAYWYYPDNNSANKNRYGLLYNWQAVTQGVSDSINPSRVQGICPPGWHVPSIAEWTQLIDYVSSQVQYECGNNHTFIAKALADTTRWTSAPNECSIGNDLSLNNATGFSALPAGKLFSGGFGHLGGEANFWSATQYDSTGAFYRYMPGSLPFLFQHIDNIYLGISVRCIRNPQSRLLPPTVITTAVTDIDTTTATTGGEVTLDGGSLVTARGVCWSTSPNPTIADNYTTDGRGMGSFTSNVTNLLSETTYYLRAYATNAIGTSYGNEVRFFTKSSNGQPCPGIPSVSDIDGNVYSVVQIGSQCWMKENLRTTRYADGRTIPRGSNASSTVAYCYYPNNDSSTVIPFGLLYNWIAATDSADWTSNNPSGVQGICPTGWHIPSDMEWVQLLSYVGSQNQYLCGNDSTYIAKALASKVEWNPTSYYSCAIGNVPSMNNATGFSALPAGLYNGTSFSFHQGVGYWTTALNYYTGGFYCYQFSAFGATVYDGNAREYYGFSVRCLHD